MGRWQGAVIGAFRESNPSCTLVGTIRLMDIVTRDFTLASAKDISSFNYFLIFGITLQYLVLLESVWYYLNLFGTT